MTYQEAKQLTPGDQLYVISAMGRWEPAVFRRLHEGAHKIVCEIPRRNGTSVTVLRSPVSVRKREEQQR